MNRYLHNSYLEDGGKTSNAVIVISKEAAISHIIQDKGYLAIYVVWTMFLFLSVPILDYILVITVTE